MRFGDLAGRRIALHFTSLVLVLVLAAAPYARADELQLVGGSPFVFHAGGGSAQVPVVSPDGLHLYVSSVGMGDIIVLDIGPGGALTLRGRFPSVPPVPLAYLAGMVFSPAGDRLYAVAHDVIALHDVAPTGELSAPQWFPAEVPWSNPLNGAAYLSLAGGDFLYLNDQAVPNTISAWRIGAGGAPEYVASYPTGGDGTAELGTTLIASPRLAGLGGRLFALNLPARLSTAPSTVSVFDVGPDGVLSAVPGSPFDMGTRAAGIAIDPSGEHLYAGGGRAPDAKVMKHRVAPDGALELVGTAEVPSVAGKPNGLAVDPTGRWVAFVATLSSTVVVLDADTLTPITGGVVPDAWSVDTGFVSTAAGLTFDASGRLYVGHTGWTPIITVYQAVASSPPPVVSCVGTAELPMILEADPTSCTATVVASNGVVGGCADGGGGLASCLLDGSEVLVLGPGLRAVEVSATSNDGAAASCTSYLQVVDVTPPLVAASPSPAVLWPPDHALRPVALGASAWDACDGALAPACAAVSNESDDDVGDGSTSPDVVWSGDALFLRAERSAVGTGRVYTITCQAADAAGNAAQAAGAVGVPHDL